MIKRIKVQNGKKITEKKYKKEAEVSKEKERVMDETSPIDLTKDVILKFPARVYQPKISYPKC